METEHPYCEQCGDCLNCYAEDHEDCGPKPETRSLYFVGVGNVEINFPVPCKVVIDGRSRCLLERGHDGGHILTP